MKKSFKILVHTGFWFIYLLIAILVFYLMRMSEFMGGEQPNYYIAFIVGIFLLPQIITFYSYYFFLFPKYLQKRKVALSVLVGLLISAVAAGIGIITVKLISDQAFNCVQTCGYGAGGFAYLTSTIIGGAGLFIKGFFTWYEDLKIKEELLEKNYAMEMALVKSQLDPHFLFNTLNNIDVLITKDPNEASIYLNKLSDIMRFMLYETKGDLIPLSKEIEYIEKYIDLQKVRTSNEDFVKFNVIGEVSGKTIAPMVFIPFIENAFKHSTNKKMNEAIDISITLEKDQMQFICKNKFNISNNEKAKFYGLGNDLIRKRLMLLYPNKHELQISSDQNIHLVHLTIQSNGKN